MSLIAGSSDEELAPSDDDQDEMPRGKGGSGGGAAAARIVQAEAPAIDSRTALKKMLKDPDQKKEVYEFAEYLGMNVDQDQEFLWIAVEAMFAPLPRNWQEFENENGQIYYYNHSTKISQWEHPLDDYHKSLYRKQKEEKSKISGPSKGEQGGKADKKRHDQDGNKSAVVKPKQHQEDASQDASAAVVLQRPKSAARAGVRPSTRGGPAERAAAEEKERQRQRLAEQEAEQARQQMQEEAEQRRQEALAAAEELKKKVKSKPRTPPPVDEAAERERAALGDKISQLQERMRQRKEELAKQKESETQAAAAGPSLSDLEKQKMEKMRQFIAQARDAKGVAPGQSVLSSLPRPGMLSPLGGVAEGGGKKLLEPLAAVRHPPSLPPLR